MGLLTALSSLIMVSAVALAGPEVSEDSPELKELFSEYEQTGETRRCLSTHRIRDIDPVSDNHWLFEINRNTYYISEVSNGCRSADSPSTVMVYRTHGSQLCRGEIVRLIDSFRHSLVRGACSLGEFERLSPIEEHDDAGAPAQ